MTPQQWGWAAVLVLCGAAWVCCGFILRLCFQVRRVLREMRRP